MHKILPVFFFSSRRRHTIWPRDWSSDVCSSDLVRSGACRFHRGMEGDRVGIFLGAPPVEHRRQIRAAAEPGLGGDRKSTRLNSSHVAISYAVFCLKKKTYKTDRRHSARDDCKKA